MKNNHTTLIILYALLSSFLVIECRSGRQTSSKERRSTPQPAIAPEKSQSIVQKPALLKEAKTKKIIAQPEATKPNQAAKKSPPQSTTTNTQKNQALYELFDKKLGYSSHLTEGVIEYVFENVFDTLAQSSQTPDKKKLQKIKGYFYGLRYPVYRHLREVISACSDPNAFLCGGIIKEITASPYNVHGKELLLTDLKFLSSTLKKFKFYQIDNQLEDELKKHLDDIESMINKTSINQGEKAIIQSHYITPLALLKEYIAQPEIKKILPSRESSLYYGYRKTAKKIVTTGTSLGHWLKERALNHLAAKAFKIFNSYVSDKFKIQQTSLEQKKYNLVSQGLDKAGEGIGAVLTNPEVLINKPLQVIATPFRGINALWQKPKLILEGLQYGRENFISGTISVAKKIGSSLSSGFEWGLFTYYELKMNEYFGTHGLNRWLTGALALAQRTVSANVKAIEPIDLQKDNLNFMTMSAAFVESYAQQLCNTIAQSPINLPESTAVLQSAQIEIFRHRRTIISELSNKHAFTYNYFLSMHQDFVKNFTSQVYESIKNAIKEKNLTIKEEELSEKAKEIIETRLSKKEEYFNFVGELTPDDYHILDTLAREVSTNPSNKDALMYLAKPIEGEVLINMITKFDIHLKKIVDELKSFGARSRNQLIQNYWLSVIDQSYGKKLQDHLEALTNDLDALMADANHTRTAVDINGNLYSYSDKKDDGSPIPIAIPAPKVPLSSAQELADIVRLFYINPLAKIAAKLQQDDILKKIPAEKSWYIKYPIYATKMNIKLQKKVIATALDNLTLDNLIAITTAFSTGGLSAVPSAALTTISFSSMALRMLNINFINPPPDGSYLSSAANDAIVDLTIDKGPRNLRKYIKGKTVTEIVSDAITKSGPVTKVKEALREHQRTARSY